MSMDDAGDAGRPRRESATVVGLRQRNRAQVLTEVILAGSLTRAEIASRTGLSLASVTKMLAELAVEGLVTEIGSRSSHGGRPIAVVAPDPAGALFIGADVGERGVAVELFDLTMTQIDREFRGGREQERPGAIAADLREAIDALAARHAGRWHTVQGIGLGLPGIVEGAPGAGQTLHAQTLGWDPVPVAQLVTANVPVHADNGAKTLATAEQWFGAAKGVDHAAVALLGRGVGLGVIAGGRLLRGAASSATEWGHVAVESGGRACRCGARGCLEAYVGADAILDQWAERGGRFEGSGWRAIGGLLEASAAGDAAAAGVVDEVVERLGLALGGVVNLFNPQRLVLGGWVGLRLMGAVADRIEAATYAAALQRPRDQFELRQATFGGDTVALGAAIMPLEALIKRGGVRRTRTAEASSASLSSSAP